MVREHHQERECERAKEREREGRGYRGRESFVCKVQSTESEYSFCWSFLNRRAGVE